MATIRIKAFLLSAIFSGNFVVVCHCSAMDARIKRPARMAEHCCCCRKEKPCKEKRTCPGTQAVKLNLVAKKAAPMVRLSAVDVIVARDYVVLAVTDRLMPRNVSSCYIPPHAPPDRLALYHQFLV